MSKEKLIPELRFPEFENEGEWNIKTIDVLCTILNNIRKPITSNDRKKGSYPYYGASGIIDFVDDYLFDETLLLVGEDGAKWGAYESTAFLVDGKYWVNNHAHVLKPNLINEKLLESYLVKLDLHPYITGAAPPKLTLGKLKEIPVPVPDKPQEQQKIATCLSSLDEVISAHSQKLELLKDHKKGLMQNLFPQEGEKVPKYRFKEFENDGEWEEIELSDLCFNISSGKDKNSENGAFELYGSTGIIGKTDSASYIGDYILVARVGANAGLLNRAKGIFGVTDNTLVLDLKKNDSTDFIQYTLEKIRLNKLVFGSGQPLITGGQLKSLLLLIPNSEEEQKKIASCLSCLDALITAQAEKIEQLKLHKKGLMQGLFPKSITN
jgi:type I restriction enzyme S subunit